MSGSPLPVEQTTPGVRVGDVLAAQPASDRARRDADRGRRRWDRVGIARRADALTVTREPLPEPAALIGGRHVLMPAFASGPMAEAVSAVRGDGLMLGWGHRGHTGESGRRVSSAGRASASPEGRSLIRRQTGGPARETRRGRDLLQPRLRRKDRPGRPARPSPCTSHSTP